MTTNNQNLITCRVTDNQQRITHAGFGRIPFTMVEEIINRMRNGEQFFTIRNENRVEVTFRDNELITMNGETLDFLPTCSFVDSNI